MAVYLVQHGKNLSKDEDPQQPLSPEGESAVRTIATLARKAGINVSEIEHSPKLRAKQTGQIYQELLQCNAGCQEREGIKAMDDPGPVAQELENRNRVMLVGHLPFMSRLASLLVRGDPDDPVVHFENGGILCLDKDGETGKWVVEWTLYPSLVQQE